jgi:membrane fusion protein (multidrug efflux system)
MLVFFPTKHYASSRNIVKYKCFNINPFQNYYFEKKMRLKKQISLFIVFLLLLSCGEDKQAQLSAPEIPVYQVEAQKIPVYQEFVGQIYGLKDIAIRARVEGFLEGIHFKEGSTVKKGKLLYTLESQPFEADAAAKMSMVAEAKTMLAKAQSDLNRIRPLAEQKAVSQSDLDAAVAIHEASIASVEAAEANLRASRIQLSYTRVHSPISGIIGKTKAKVGDFVGRSPNPVILNVVSRTDTVLVDFFITETQYLTLARHRQAQQQGPARRRDRDDVRLILADGSRYPYQGKYNFVDRNVDPTTGALLVQTSFPNTDELLRPGQFAKVVALVAEVEDGIIIPQRCVTELQGLYSVFVVNDSNMVKRREVKVGPKISDFWMIESGLKAGENVVYEGLQKVRDGIVVNPVIHDIKPIDTTSQNE